MTANFLLSAGTIIVNDTAKSLPVLNAVKLLKRDLKKVLLPSISPVKNKIKLRIKQGIGQSETFTFQFEFSMEGKPECLVITGADELGLIYGLLYLSRTYLGIPPFWFWNDFIPKQVQMISIPAENYSSKPYRIHYRGWFVNDEMLLLGWHKEKYDKQVWKAVFEALLRCGGNMVIPGTGETSRRLEQLASEMGLILTHHHAEPLGAELFLTVYPDREPSYRENAPLYEELWKKAVLRQKDKKTVWTLGFRGQGDRPFWADDPSYATPKARGRLISEVIRRQYRLVCRYVENPVCCTNLYGEIMQLYRDGLLTLPEGVIKIWADNGYGRMVSRRQGNRNPRIFALPDKKDQPPHGLYYHVTFHDLQASNHLTMEPNSPRMISEELQKAFSAGADEYLILNCGNVRPHTYLLDLVSEYWQNGTADVSTHRDRYIADYFRTGAEKIAPCYEGYSKAAVSYGEQEDEHAGEQFYHYPVREIISHWMKGCLDEPEKQLIWAAGNVSFHKQIHWFAQKYKEGKNSWSEFNKKCVSVCNRLDGKDRQLFSDKVLLQGMLHQSGCEGGLFVCKSFFEFEKKCDLQAYLFANAAMQAYQKGLAAMRGAEQGHWKNFYRNDCLTNVKLTIYFVDNLRRYLRLLGDGTDCLNWEKQYLLPENSRRVMLETTVSNQLTDDELYEKLKQVPSLFPIK